MRILVLFISLFTAISAFGECRRDGDNYVFIPPISPSTNTQRTYNCNLYADRVFPLPRPTEGDQLQAFTLPGMREPHYVHSQAVRDADHRRGWDLDHSARGLSIDRSRQASTTLLTAQVGFSSRSMGPEGYSGVVKILRDTRHIVNPGGRRNLVIPQFLAQQVVECNDQGQEEVHLVISNQRSTPRSENLGFHRQSTYPVERVRDLRTFDQSGRNNFRIAPSWGITGTPFVIHANCSEAVDGEESCTGSDCGTPNGETSRREPSSVAPKKKKSLFQRLFDSLF
jgi:hypothetical protein